MTMNKTAPPNSEAAEGSVLASIIESPLTYLTKAKAEKLLPSHFFHRGRSRLFAVYLDRLEQGLPLEHRPVMEQCIREGINKDFGGDGNLLELGYYKQMGSSFDQHVAVVKSCYALRLISQKLPIVTESTRIATTTGDVVRDLEEIVASVRLVTGRKRAFLSASQSVKAFLAAMNERVEFGDLPGLPTGIDRIDDHFGGLRPGELWVIAGETSSGKSVLSIQMLRHAIEIGKNVLIFTLEMTADEIIGRMVSNSQNVPMHKIMKPRQAGKGYLEKIRQGASIYADGNLQVCDEANISIDHICATAEEVAEEKGVAVILVDYIQLVESRSGNRESREQELSTIAKRLKQLAKKLNCPIIAPAQLNDDGKLRESRAIGQTADNMLKIKDVGVLVSKARNGERDVLLPIFLNGEFQRFEVNQFQQR